MNLTDGLLLFFVVTGVTLSILLKKLTPVAALLGGLMCAGIYLGGGWTSVTVMAVFFISGVLATAWKAAWKEKMALSEPAGGRRTAGQVFANAGMAAIIGVIAFIFPELALNASLLITACFASATSDTLSSELGNIYGSRYYNIISFKKAKRGANGVVSLEGSLWGVGGSFIIAVLYAFWMGWSTDVYLIVLAGVLGNITDSLLGAWLEEKGYLSNNAVNFLNTCVAAVFMLVIKAIS